MARARKAGHRGKHWVRREHIVVSGRQPQLARTISPTALLPLFLDSAHTVAMIRHSVDVVKNAVEHVNPGQTPVITLDQPLFALAKQIQWKWPEKYGEDKMVVMCGGLHIEMECCCMYHTQPTMVTTRY